MHQSEQNKTAISQIIAKKKSPALKSRGTSPFFGTTVKEEISVSLKLIDATGGQKAFHYHDLQSPMEFDGTSEIAISTSRLSIKIFGKNLNELFDGIIQHRVMWIKELSNSFHFQQEAKEPVVEGILIEEL